MGQLTDALVGAVGARLLLAKPVHSISRSAEGLVVERQDGVRELASEVVLATPARLASALLAPLQLSQVEPLQQAPLLSNVSVNLAYREQQLSSYPAGSGVIFPESFASRGLRALSLVNHKFAGRAPAGIALVRVFFRPQGDALSAWTDERFTIEAAAAIAQVLTVEGEPQHSWVSRWADALPVFSPAHKAQAEAADQTLQAVGIHVTGSAFHGAGIDAAVASAETVAARLGALA
jgi:oxygen-dependent protoporphyrinogen oxidase